MRRFPALLGKSDARTSTPFTLQPVQTGQVIDQKAKTAASAGNAAGDAHAAARGDAWDEAAASRSAAILGKAVEACGKTDEPTLCSCTSAAVSRHLGMTRPIRRREAAAILESPAAGDALTFGVATIAPTSGHCWAMEHDGRCWTVYQSFLGHFGPVAMRRCATEKQWAKAVRQSRTDTSELWRLLDVSDLMEPNRPALAYHIHTNKPNPAQTPAPF